MIPRAASKHEVDQDRISLIATRSIRRIWRRMPVTGSWERAWREDVGPRVQEVVTAAQEASAATAEVYVASVLAELGIDPDVPTSLNIDAFPGVAGDGRPVESLTYGSVIRSVRTLYGPEVASVSESVTSRAAEIEALLVGGDWLERVTAGILADTTRAASQAAAAQRTEVTGYVRMVNPGACSRCVVLAGRFYRFNAGFSRHEPTCRCTHIPASENVAGDLLTSPDRYFESLSKDEQDRVFTQAGAEAIRMGADIGQVVNARRGMSTAQVAGRKRYVTTSGRGFSARNPRLMPETILAEAKSPEDALRLLKRFGYVL